MNLPNLAAFSSRAAPLRYSRRACATCFHLCPAATVSGVMAGVTRAIDCPCYEQSPTSRSVQDNTASKSVFETTAHRTRYQRLACSLRHSRTPSTSTLFWQKADKPPSPSTSCVCSRSNLRHLDQNHAKHLAQFGYSFPCPISTSPTAPRQASLSGNAPDTIFVSCLAGANCE